MSRADADPRRWRILALLAVAELLGMSLWFTATAVSAELGARWDLSPGEVGWLATAVNLGFVAGTAVAAVLNLADIIRSRTYFAVAAVLAALANAAVLVAPGFAAAVASRFATGFLLAGVYPPAMKMAATWFRSSRGLAIGTIVGALTVGKAMPYLLGALPDVGAEGVVSAASAGALLGAALVAVFYRDGPFPLHPGPVLVGTRRPRGPSPRDAPGHGRATWVTCGSCMPCGRGCRPSWRLRARRRARAGVWSSWPASARWRAGGAGCVWGGWAADRIGRERLVVWAMAVSGLCCLVIGPLFGTAFLLVAVVTLVWGFFVVADSAQFSALVTEVAPEGTAGTALTLQTCVGFLLASVTVQAVPWTVEVAGWRWSFAVLALGPAAGIAAIRRLARLRARGGRVRSPG